MSAAFTPGPWYVCEPFAGFGAIKQYGSDALIFGLAAGDPGEKQSDDVCEANARLIAEAPMLHRALERIAEMTDIEADFDGFEARQIAQAALAKARGETA